MKLPNTERGFPAGGPNEHWTKEQFVARLRYQLKNLLANDRKIFKAVGATEQDLHDIRRDIEELEKEIAIEKSRLN